MCTSSVQSSSAMFPPTLTRATDIAWGLGGGTGITRTFTSSYWWHTRLLEASIEMEDHVWGMSLFERCIRQITDCQLIAVNNSGQYRSAGSCPATAYLNGTHSPWAHLDIEVMTSKDEIPCLRKSMTKRPTRTPAEFLGSVKTRARFNLNTMKFLP